MSETHGSVCSLMRGMEDDTGSVGISKCPDSTRTLSSGSVRCVRHVPGTIAMTRVDAAVESISAHNDTQLQHGVS